MATLVLRAQEPARLPMSFKGDHAHLLDQLIAASARKEVPTEALQERTLVPFFDSSDMTATSFQALQPASLSARRAASTPIAAAKAAAPRSGQPAHGLKRHAHERSGANLVGSPPRKETELIQAKHQRRASKGTSNSGGKGASAASSAASSDSETTSVRKPRAPGSAKKHQREASLAAAPGGSTSQRLSPPRKRPEGGAPVDMHTLAAASAAASASLRTPAKTAGKAAALALPSKFAGPAFTNSPTPDSLPIPTSSLLLQAAADGLRARLTL